MYCIQIVGMKAREHWDAFLDFALRENVVEVAVGLMYVLSFLLLSIDCHKPFPDS